MTRGFIRSLFAGFLFVITYYLIQLLWGLYQTKTYVPEIMNSYHNVETLQHEAAFGIVADPTRMLVELLVLFLLGVTVYYAIQKVRSK